LWKMAWDHEGREKIEKNHITPNRWTDKLKSRGKEKDGSWILPRAGLLLKSKVQKSKNSNYGFNNLGCGSKKKGGEEWETG